MKSSPALKRATQPTPARSALEATPAAQLQQRAREAATLLKALANPDRLLLLCHLVDGERSVAELGEMTGIPQPSLSQQLGVLRSEELVATRREGKFVHYRVASPAVLEVLRTLYRLYCADDSAAMP
jgi:ArsR family transcriptional regulator